MRFLLLTDHMGSNDRAFPFRPPQPFWGPTVWVESQLILILAIAEWEISYG
jgi:hypothetical protein